MKNHGFVRVGAIVPKVKVANCKYNADEIIKGIEEARRAGVQIVAFPELSLTGATCGDLFSQKVLIESVKTELRRICGETKGITAIIGAPIRDCSAAVVMNDGHIVGIVPKKDREDEIDGIPFSADLVFSDGDFSFSIWHDNGAAMIFDLAASKELVGKHDYRRDFVRVQSAELDCAYIYVSAGVHESTTDILCGGSAIIAENGTVIKENERFSFEPSFIYEDVDVQRLASGSSGIQIDLGEGTPIKRHYSRTPFVPENELEKMARCEEILAIQSCALAKRLVHTGVEKCVVGLSGGLDSTLAFLVVLETYKRLDISNKNLIAVVMPGFGTTDRTYNNAVELAKTHGVTLREIDIKPAVLQHFDDIGHNGAHDITYENAQARERTQILMDIANMENAIVIGTGNMSELALGWCTYNGDHMSMYAVNSGVPKTIIPHMVQHVLGDSDILKTPISPELIPGQVTEDVVGPYILHDFFLYHFLRYGASPAKILYLAVHAFPERDDIKKWLEIFLKRFFAGQFKRNCMPDGVAVGTVSLNNLSMPSDADVEVWLDDV